MLIDKLDVDKSGMTCNKIGVSYTAFRDQGNACGSLPMSCLQNQIEDHHQSGNYFLSKFGEFQVWNQTDKILLSKLVNSFQPSVLTLTMNADNIIYLINKSPGQLTKTWVAAFESLSKNGLMYVQMENTGDLQSKYSITVTECSPNINPIDSKSILASPKVITQLTFDITTNTELDSHNICQVKLYDSQGGFLDQLEVKFDTTATVHLSDPTPPTGSPTNTNQNGGVSGLLSLFQTSCNCSILDITCILSGCLLWVIVSIGIIILIIVFCLIFTFAGGWCYLFKCICFAIKLQKCCCKSVTNNLPEIELKEIQLTKKEKKKIVFINIKNQNPNFLPLTIGDEFSIKGIIKNEKNYIIFSIKDFKYQHMEYKDDEYVKVTTPIEILKLDIIKMRKERFYEEIDVTSKPKYTCINSS